MTHTVTVVIPFGWMMGFAFWLGAVFAVVGCVALDVHSRRTEG